MPITLNGTTGEVFPSWTTGTRPASPSAGQTGYNSTLATLEVYNGSSWCPFSSSTTTPAFGAYAGAGTSVANSTATKIAFNTSEFDTNSNYSTTNSRFTVTIAGVYQINAAVNFGGYYAYAGVYLYKNGASFKVGASGGTTNSVAGANYIVSSLVNLVAGDYIEIWVNQSSGGTITTATGQANTYFNGCLVRSA